MRPLHAAVYLCIGILMTWGSYPYWLLWRYGQDASLEKFGQFGDSFGALNTLFAGVGLVGLAINIYLQNQQIRQVEAKERQNEGMLAKQVSVMRLTALLQYYNGQIDPLEKQVFELDQELGELKNENAKYVPNIHGMDHQELIAVLAMRGYLKAANAIGRVVAALTNKQQKLNELISARQLIFDELNTHGK